MVGESLLPGSVDPTLLSCASPKSKTLTVPSGLSLMLLRLQVAVHDTLVMRGFECVGHLTSDAERFLEGKRAFLDSVG